MDLSLSSIMNIPSVIKYHYKEGNINWPMSIYITLVHIIALYALIHKVWQCSAETLLWAFILWPIRYVAIQTHTGYSVFHTFILQS